jgi:hypothetical protein
MEEEFDFFGNLENWKGALLSLLINLLIFDFNFENLLKQFSNIHFIMQYFGVFH